MIELLNGSLGDHQPTFAVTVSEPISLDQAEHIVALLKKSIDQARNMLKTEPATGND